MYRIRQLNPIKVYRFGFNMAGIVPVAGLNVDFGVPWPACLMPLKEGYTLLHHAIAECAYAGCKSVWVVCDDDMRPLLKRVVGEMVLDPKDVYISTSLRAHNREMYYKRIPIFFVPVEASDRDVRYGYPWSILHGAKTAYFTLKKITTYILPARYYVSFPYGVYSLDAVADARKHLTNYKEKEPIYLTNDEGDTVNFGEQLGFSFDYLDFDDMMEKYLASNAKYSEMRAYSVADVVNNIKKTGNDIEFRMVSNYHAVDTWEGFEAAIKDPIKHVPVEIFKNEKYWQTVMEAK